MKIDDEEVRLIPTEAIKRLDALQAHGVWADPVLEAEDIAALRLGVAALRYADAGERVDPNLATTADIKKSWDDLQSAGAAYRKLVEELKL
jgi:hypothetical protein